MEVGHRLREGFSTTEQNLGLRHEELKPAFDLSVDLTDAR